MRALGHRSYIIPRKNLWHSELGAKNSTFFGPVDSRIFGIRMLVGAKYLRTVVSKLKSTRVHACVHMLNWEPEKSWHRCQSHVTLHYTNLVLNRVSLFQDIPRGFYADASTIRLLTSHIEYSEKVDPIPFALNLILTQKPKLQDPKTLVQIASYGDVAVAT